MAAPSIWTAVSDRDTVSDRILRYLAGGSGGGAADPWLSVIRPVCPCMTVIPISPDGRIRPSDGLWARRRHLLMGDRGHARGVSGTHDTEPPPLLPSPSRPGSRSQHCVGGQATVLHHWKALLRTFFIRGPWRQITAVSKRELLFENW